MLLVYNLFVGTLFACGVLVYLHALFKFHSILQAEKPDWIDRRGSLSFFYDGMPRIADPNVGLAVISTAFSSRIYQLQAPMAVSYAKRIRVLLLANLVVFVGLLAGVSGVAP